MKKFGTILITIITTSIFAGLQEGQIATKSASPLLKKNSKNINVHMQVKDRLEENNVLINRSTESEVKIKEFKNKLQTIFKESKINSSIEYNYNAILQEALLLSGYSRNLCSIIEFALYSSQSDLFLGQDSQQCLEELANKVLESLNNPNSIQCVAKDRLLIEFLDELRRANSSNEYFLLDFSKLKSYFKWRITTTPSKDATAFIKNYYKLGLIFESENDFSDLFYRTGDGSLLPLYPLSYINTGEDVELVIKTDKIKASDLNRDTIKFFLKILSLEKFQSFDYYGPIFRYFEWTTDSDTSLIHENYANTLIDILYWTEANFNVQDTSEIIKIIDTVNKLLDTRRIVNADDVIIVRQKTLDAIVDGKTRRISKIYDARHNFMINFFKKHPEALNWSFNSENAAIYQNKSKTSFETLERAATHLTNTRQLCEISKFILAKGVFVPSDLKKSSIKPESIKQTFIKQNNLSSFSYYRSLLELMLAANSEYYPKSPLLSSFESLIENYSTSLSEVDENLQLKEEEGKVFYQIGGENKPIISIPAGIFYVDHDIKMIAKKIISHPLALLYAPGRNVEIVADEVSDLFISVSDYKNDMFNEGIENGIIYNGKKYDIFPQIDGGDAGSISITAKNSIHGNNILLAHGKKGGIISISTPPSSAMKIFATVEGKKQYRCETTGTPIEECLSFDVDYDSFDDLSGQIIWSKR